MTAHLNRIIHASFRSAGIVEDDDKRAIYARVTGKAGLTVMSDPEKEAVAAELRKLGAKPARRANGRAALSGPFAKKLQALWIACWNLGITRDRDDAALEAFITRQTGIERERWLHKAGDAAKVIEALKGWMAREANVFWGTPAPRDWLTHDGARIAWAQWKILNPKADLVARYGFDSFVATCGGTLTMEAKGWITVMNALGAQIRARKAVA